MTGGELRGVFVNCPFDSEYKACQRAMILAIVACGLQPRSALEGGAQRPRLQRISTALRASQYSIHDLTRVAGAGEGHGERYNMPFEFGMAYLLSEMQEGHEARHDWLVLVPRERPYAEFISDLGGYDLEAHDGTPEGVLPKVLAWLSTRPGLPAVPPGINPTSLIEALPEFNRQLDAAESLWHQDLSWSKRVEIARDVVGAGFYAEKPDADSFTFTQSAPIAEPPAREVGSPAPAEGPPRTSH